MSNPENDQTLIENYFPFPSPAQTMLMLFEREPDQFNMLWKTWNSKEGFQAIPREAPYEKLTFDYPITGNTFNQWTGSDKTFLGFVNGAPTQIVCSSFLNDLDNKIREVGNLNLLGTDFENYSIDGIQKVLIVEVKKVAGVKARKQVYVGTQFDDIMQDEANQEIFINAQLYCWSYGASVEPYLKAAYQEKLKSLGIV